MKSESRAIEIFSMLLETNEIQQFQQMPKTPKISPEIHCVPDNGRV